MFSTFTALFKSKNLLSADVMSLKFDLQSGARLEFEPGQYVVVHVPRSKEEFARRIFSLTNAAGSTGSFELLAKIIPGGVASEYFKAIKTGEKAEFGGPAGVFTLRKTDKNKLFIATGTGIAPIMSIFRTYLDVHTNSSFKFIWGLKKKEDIYFIEELEEMSKKHPNFTYDICLSREVPLESFQHKYRDNIVFGRVNTKIDQLISNIQLPISNNDFYVCGDRNIVESIRQHLLELSVPKEAISFEKFA